MINNISLYLNESAPMKYPSEHKEESRKRIIKAARTVFGEVGFDQASIDQVMSEANMTRGGFYKHFPNKLALLVEIISDGEVGVPDEIDCPVEDILKQYVSEQHLEDKANACPLFLFPSDVARHGDAAKMAYEKVASSISDVFSTAMPGKSREAALATMAMSVGCMVVMNSSHSKEFKLSLRSATLMQIQKLLDEAKSEQPDSAQAIDTQSGQHCS